VRSPQQLQCTSDGNEWHAWYTEHLKLAKLTKERLETEGAMTKNQRFSFIVGFNTTDDGLPRVSSCANTEVSRASDDRRLSREQLEDFHRMWKHLYP